MCKIIIHRKSRSGYSLCGKKIKNEFTTLTDEKVTCNECKEILGRIQMTDTKTSILSKYWKK